MTVHSRPEQLVEEQLSHLLGEVELELSANGLAFAGPISYGADDVIREEIEEISPKRDRLAVFLETDGGYIEVAQRIADTFRHHYNHVDFLVLSHAMSAGTVLVMSGDSIHMDYYSILGPIDPQVRRYGSNVMVPAMGYLAKYEKLIQKATTGGLSSAEITYLVERFDPAELYFYEQARELSISLLKEWLAKYKFKNWLVTETHRTPVTDEMRQLRAEEIANALNDSNRWHSHSRGISLAILVNDLNLLIDDLGRTPTGLGGKARAYFKLLRRYMSTRGHASVLHRRNRYFPIGQEETS